jgi:uncharacterized RDD family membrane protein YckC
MTTATEYQAGWASGLRAGFWTRCVAALIDGLIVAIPIGVLNVTLKTLGYYLGLLIGVAYFIYFEGGPSGAGPGKRMMGICVVDLATGGPIGYWRAFVRYLGRALSSLAFFLGYAWMLWDREKQCWHDKFAGDVVVPVVPYQAGY